MNKFKNVILILMVVLGLNFQVATLDAATTTKVEPCSTSGSRVANTTVDIGFDSSYANRKYYAKTNASKQLVSVTAKEIILQNDNKEPVKSTGRYCSDEAKVSGVEKSNLDEGHAIADSLGGVSNSYNITPQDSKLNRSGAQYKFEEEIRKAELSGKQVTDFKYVIKYPNTKTMTPSSYSVSYKIDGKVKSYNFSNTGTKSTSTDIKNGWSWGSKAYNSNGNYLYTNYKNGKVVETRLYKTKKATKANLIVQTKYVNGKKSEKINYKQSKVVQRLAYTTNGKNKKQTKYYTNGKYKEVRYYHSNGKVKTVKKYNTKGKETSTKQYTTAGKEVTAKSKSASTTKKSTTKSKSSSSAKKTIDGKAVTAKCKDGTYSTSQSRSGTCSRHKGVATWY